MNSKTQFNTYSKYYDFLYKNKYYKKEVLFLKKTFKKFNLKQTKDILSLGCGTCEHDILFAKEGYSVTGIDLSSSMLEIAKQKAKSKNVSIDLKKGDVRTFRTTKKFDAIIAMFNIAGYQNTLEDFNKFIKTAEVHLKKDGLLLFDAWYQPAVLKDKPTNRKKKITICKNHFIERKTTQNLDIQKSLLEISFEMNLEGTVSLITSVLIFTLEKVIF